ncbi:hypothetical protein ACFL2O_04670 [Thermodesulfobacteriota bacterium]
MEPSTNYEFTVDEQYENEKGIFTVVSIKRQEMVIRWENGETITTSTSLQGRIQERKEREKIAKEEKDKGTKKRPRKKAKTTK